MDVLKTIANNYLQYSTQVNPTDNRGFPSAAVEKTIRTTLVDKAKNPQSLAYDEFIPGRTFYQDLKGKIAATTPWGGNPAAVESIANSMVHNPEHKHLLNKEFTEYFTKYIKKQWDMGIANRPNPTKEKQPNPDGSIDWKA